MSRRVATVFTEPLRPFHRGKEVGLIPLGLRDRGWAVETHAPDADPSLWDYPVHVASLEQLAAPAYWAGRELDALLVYSFFRHEPIMRAVRAAGARVVVKGDTDGLLSARLEPRRTFAMAAHAGTARTRPLQVAHWLARLGPLHRREVAQLAAAVELADAFALESDPARDRLAAILRHHGRADLVARLHVVPSPASPAFTRTEVLREREPLVVAAGRWDDPQKNAPLLAAALERFLAEHPGWRAHVVGAGAEALFRRHGIEVTSQLAHDDLATLVRRARVVASSSRWESFSLAVHEGLACGCSFAATPLAPFRHAAARGPFGTLAGRRGAAGLAAALAAEAAAWDSGARDPAAIAAFWRGELDVDAVAGRFETLLAPRAA